MKHLLTIPAALGERAAAVTVHTGQWAVFSLTALAGLLRPRGLMPKILRDIHFIGFKSLSIIVLVAFFTGMVLGLQEHHYSDRKSVV